MDITGARRYALRLMAREGGYMGVSPYGHGYIVTDGSNSALVSVAAHAHLVKHKLIAKVATPDGGHDIWRITDAGREAFAVAVAQEA